MSELFLLFGAEPPLTLVLSGAACGSPPACWPPLPSISCAWARCKPTFQALGAHAVTEAEGLSPRNWYYPARRWTIMATRETSLLLWAHFLGALWSPRLPPPGCPLLRRRAAAAGDHCCLRPAARAQQCGSCSVPAVALVKGRQQTAAQGGAWR